jgi:hypothetical protein
MGYAADKSLLKTLWEEGRAPGTCANRLNPTAYSPGYTALTKFWLDLPTLVTGATGLVGGGLCGSRGAGQMWFALFAIVPQAS